MTFPRCPICGAKDAACGHNAPIDQAKILDLSVPDVGGTAMPPKAVDSPKMRMPQQHVRPGRGVPGYTGNVEVIPTKAPRNLEATVVTSKNVKDPKVTGKNKAAEAKAKATAKGEEPQATE